MNLLLIGAPSSGKGTQAEKLIKKFGLAYVEMGGLLRKIEEEDTPLGNKVKEFVEKGLLVPDDLMFEVINGYLRGIEKLKGIVFDGFPRLVSQAEYFEKFLADKGKKIDIVFFLTLPKEVVFKRVTGRKICERCGQVYNLVTKPPKVEGICDACGGKLISRTDEDPEEIKKRLEEFEKHTRPLIEFYRSRRILEEVDGNRPIELIAEDIFGRIAKRELA